MLVRIIAYLFFFCSVSCHADVFGDEAVRLEQAANRLKSYLVSYSHGRIAPAASTTGIEQRNRKDFHVLNIELAKIRTNIKRWRQAPLLASANLVLVDIAGFELYYYVSGKRTFQTHALVGQKSTPTPVFQTEIEKIILNPTWTIPESIVLKEVLPLLQKDIRLVSEQEVEVYRVTSRGLKRMALESVQWSTVNIRVFPYVFKQRPGEGNPLGKIKFVSKNPYSIYLHGTADPELFNSSHRAISHGCVRLEKALDLAAELLKTENSDWTREKLARAMQAKQEIQIPLKQKVPLYFGYWTARADNNLHYHLREDIYGWDEIN